MIETEGRKDLIKYLRIALGLQGIGTSNEMCDRIIETYNEVVKHKGKFSIEDAVRIENLMDKKYVNKTKSK